MYICKKSRHILWNIQLSVSVCFCKSLYEKCYTHWKLRLHFRHTKVLEIFDGIVSSESISQFIPVFVFFHSSKTRVICCFNYLFTCKANSSFSNKSLVTTLTPGVSRLQLRWWLSCRCTAIFFRYKPKFSLITAL